MTYLILAVLCSVAVSIFLKLARRNRIDIAQAIAVNYLMATALTWFYLKPNLSAINAGSNTIGLFVALGILLPAVFIIMSKAVDYAGIVKSDAAQRLSLFIPILWALVFFGETLTKARGLGIVLAFAALLCLLYKSSAGRANGKLGGSGKQIALSLLGVWLGYGVIDILFKQVAKSGSAFAGNLFVAFVLAGLLIFVYLFVKRTAWSGKSLFAGLLLGALNFGNILFYVRAHQVFKDDPTLVFAGMNVGVITLGTLVGALLFREKISRINALGIVLAILSIVSLFYLSKWLPQLA